MDILFIIALIIASIVAVTFLIERGLALRWDKVIPPQVVEGVHSYHEDTDLPMLKYVCEQHPSPIARLLLFATDHLDYAKHENAAILEVRARHEVTRLERGLVVLEILVGIAPLLGLTGTIYGLIILFGSLDQNLAVESGRFAEGISLALRATLMGLLVAIPALIGWSYYTKKVENLTVEMENICDEFLRKHYRAQNNHAGQSPSGTAGKAAAPAEAGRRPGNPRRRRVA